MKTLVSLALLTGFTSGFLAGIAICHRYQIQPTTPGQTFLVDNWTGYIWRYYRNTDTNGDLKSEGFCRLSK